MFCGLFEDVETGRWALGGRWCASKKPKQCTGFNGEGHSAALWLGACLRFSRASLWTSASLGRLAVYVQFRSGPMPRFLPRPCDKHGRPGEKKCNDATCRWRYQGGGTQTRGGTQVEVSTYISTYISLVYVHTYEVQGPGAPAKAACRRRFEMPTQTRRDFS